MWETWVQSLGWEDPLEKEMATHSSTLAWKIPWMEEPGRLQSIGLQRVGHDWATSLVHWLHGATEYIYCFSKSCAKYTETNGYKVFEQRESNVFIVTQNFESDNAIMTFGLQLTKQIIWLNLYVYIDIVNTIQTAP